MSLPVEIQEVLEGKRQWWVECCDCLEMLPRLPADLSVVTDPPYGMAANTNSRRFSGGVHGEARYGGNGSGGMGRAWQPINGDDKPFDPTPFLRFKRVVLWGWNHFAARLPLGTVLVWLKKDDHLFGTFLSDAELGWMKGGCGVYAFKRSFPPPVRIQQYDGHQAAHPTQKPVELMGWCIEKNSTEGDSIVDAYAGSGTTGVAAIQLGRRFIGFEISPEYAQLARDRISAAEKGLTVKEYRAGQLALFS